jgi:hypothetical protein
MITEASPYSTTISEDFEIAEFGIKESNMSHIIDIVENRLYSNKPLAVIREYSTNALDANRMAGRSNLPVKITLPSRFDQTFKVRDYGSGLTHKEMVNIFISYGESTKRGSNVGVGQMGIGSKAGLSYGGNFLVVSYMNGTKTVYNCVKDSPRNKLITLTTDTTTEPDGLEIVISVKSEDTNYFIDYAKNFFKYWPKGSFEIEGFTETDYTNLVDFATVLSGTGWRITKSTGDSYYNRRSNGSKAIMGCISYPINWDNVKWGKFFETNNRGGLHGNSHNFITESEFIFDFNIGDIKMSPSRESLEYIEKTNDAILARVEVVLNEIAVECQKRMDTATSLWQAKKMYYEIFDQLSSSLHRLKGVIKLTYKGISITNEIIDGFAGTQGTVSVPAVSYLGFNGGDPYMKTYTKRNSIFRCQPINVYNYNSISCKTSAMILLVDQKKAVYVQKALKYLEETKNCTTFYVFEFADDVERDTIFTNVLHNDVPFTKYSDISDAVKKTILRNSSSGVVSTTPRDTNMRNIRFLDTVNSRSYYGYGSRSDWSATDKDMSEGGVYVEMESGTPKNATNIYDRINFIRDHIDKNFKVLYGINQKVMEGKAFELNKSKWTDFDTYYKAEIAKYLQGNADLELYAAYKSLADREVNVFSVTSYFSAWLSKTYKKGDLAELAKFHNVKFEPLMGVLTEYITVTDANKAKVKALFDSLETEYSLIGILNQGFHNLDIDNKEKIKKYLDKV